MYRKQDFCRKELDINKSYSWWNVELTLYFSPCCMYNSGYKSPEKNKVNGPHSKKLGHPVSFLFPSLSLTLFFRLIPWSTEAPCVHLSAWVSKTWMGRCSVSSLPRETGKAPVASVNRANSLSRSFIGFLCKPRNTASFSSLFSYLQHSFLISL